MHVTIDFPTKQLSGLKLTPYTLCSLIRFRQGKHGYNGRCRDTRGFLADVMDISRRQVITLIAELVEAGFVEEAPDKSLQTTAKWEEIVEAGKRLDIEGVKKLHEVGCEETSHQGVKKLHAKCEETAHNKEVIKEQIITHTPAREEVEEVLQPDSESLYDMIKARIAFAPTDLKDKWAKKGLKGEELKILIELFATKEVGKIKGDAFEVREEVERLCSTPNYWARLFTNSYVPKWTPANQPTRKAPANYHEAPKMSAPRRGPII